MKLNKKLLSISIAAALAAPAMVASTAAHAEVSANVTVTSNYMWRGMSLSSDAAAVQGGLDYNHASGFFAGVWASTLGSGNGTEVDYYFGFGGELGDFGYTATLNRYTYPDTSGADYTDLGIDLSYKMISGGIWYTVDSQASSGQYIEDDIYYYLGFNTGLPQDFTLDVTVGKYDFEDNSATDYKHITLTVGKSAGNLGDFAFALDKNDIPGDKDVKATVSWSKTF